jgi:hypothetical protein
MKTVKYNVPSPSQKQLLNINNFAGINLNVTPTQIAENESPDMLNMFITDSGRLEKRTGYDKVFTSLGTGNINGMYEFGDMFLFAHGTKLYYLNSSNVPTLLYDGLANNRVTFFTFNGLCYILDGTHYLQFDGTTVTTPTPYIPTMVIASNPSGAGTTFEQFNLLGSGFKHSFTADGTTKDYQLCLNGLDATAVVASFDYGTTFNKVEGTDFTVNRTTGVVSFLTAPPSQNPDNVVIKAYKTVTDLQNRIKQCTDYVCFGGVNDTHVLFYGNPNTPSVIYRSGVIDPTYFPENYYQAIGNTSEKIQKMVLQYDTCIAIKEKSIWYIDFQLNSSGEAMYPVRPINDTIGCNNPYTVQLMENTPVFLNRRGMYVLSQSNVRSEKNVSSISERIDKLLLADTIKAAIDYDNKLILAGTKCYIFDYANNAWLLWDNIPAVCFLEYNKELYLGDSNGTIHRFKVKDKDRFPFVDNGLAINAYWKSKPFGMGAEEKNKLVQKLFVTLAPYKRTSANFYYVTEMVSIPRNQDNLPNYSNMMYSKSFYNDKIFDAKSEFIDTVRIELMDYSDLDYSLFSYDAELYPTEFTMKVKAKKIVYYQFVVQNYKINENVGIDGFVLKYYVQNYRK